MVFFAHVITGHCNLCFEKVGPFIYIRGPDICHGDEWMFCLSCIDRGKKEVGVLRPCGDWEDPDDHIKFDTGDYGDCDKCMHLIQKETLCLIIYTTPLNPLASRNREFTYCMPCIEKVISDRKWHCYHCAGRLEEDPEKCIFKH